MSAVELESVRTLAMHQIQTFAVTFNSCKNAITFRVVSVVEVRMPVLKPLQLRAEPAVPEGEGAYRGLSGFQLQDLWVN